MIELYQDKTACCGCAACMNACPKQAISMTEDEHGFVYPKIDEALCIGCGLCKRVCAYQNGLSGESARETWVAAAEDADLSQSASGGLFASFAQAVIKAGGVVYGCALQEQDGRLTARHIRVEKLDELIGLKGSKYVHSDIGYAYRDAKALLDAGTLVLFSGTPCQVAGLRGYLRREYENLFTVDIICHGVPSQRFFRDYLAFSEKKAGGKIVGFRFRDKSAGWQLHGCMIVETPDGMRRPQYFEPEESSYYQMFLNSYTYRENCYSCPYAGGERPGDVTIGDYWNIDLVHPQVLTQNGGRFDEKRGISCLVVHGEHGRELVNRFGKGIALEVSAYDQAARYNAQLLRPSVLKPERELVLNMYRESGYAQIEAWYQKRLRKIRFVRALRAAVPRPVKNMLKAMLRRG